MIDGAAIARAALGLDDDDARALAQHAAWRALARGESLGPGLCGVVVAGSVATGDGARVLGRGGAFWGDALALRDTTLMVFTEAALEATPRAAIAFGRAAASQLFGLTPLDPVSLGVAASLLGAVGACAGYLPARRAAATDPTTALRAD
jgi:ABC-type antimicrobial peptide transport system permease subunit